MAKTLRRGIADLPLVSSLFPSIASAIGKLSTSGDISNGAILTKYADEFAKMSADVVSALKDGCQFSDILLLSQLVPEVMGIAKNIEGMSGEDKKAFVIDAVWVIYHAADTGPDGKQNRFKVPFLNVLSYIGITSSEEKLERFILKVATEFAINAAYPYLKEKGKV